MELVESGQFSKALDACKQLQRTEPYNALFKEYEQILRQAQSEIEVSVSDESSDEASGISYSEAESELSDSGPEEKSTRNNSESKQ